MVDPKDRQNRDRLSVVPGAAESARVTSSMQVQNLGQTQPAPIETSVGLSPDQLRPPISPDLEAIGVEHGEDTLRLSDNAQQVVQTHNPPLRTLPGGSVYTPEEFDRKSGGDWKTGGTGIGIVGSRQIDREEELKNV